MSSLNALADLTGDSIDISDNVIEDVVAYARGSFIANEQPAVLSFLQYCTGWQMSMDYYVNSVLIGPSSGGKTMVQKNMVKLIPEEYRYETTNATGNAMLDDEEWDKALIAPLDELDKIDKEIRRYMKSMAGEDEGYSKKRDVEDEDSPTGYSPVEVTSDAMPYQFLWADDGAKTMGASSNELKNRMMEIPVEDNVHIREAIGKMRAGYTDIQIKGYDHEYVYDTVALQSALLRHVEELPLESWTVEQNDAELLKRRGGCLTVMPRWVWVSLDPIFNKSRTYTNRVYGMVFGLIRASAIANYHNRPTTTVEIEDERYDGKREVDAYVVHPQDVANVVACQETLLATTHELDERKRNYLDAIRYTQGLAADEYGEDCGGTTTLDKILEWLEDNDKPHPKEQTLRKHLEELEQQYFININENAAPDGRSHLYELRTGGSIQPPRTTNLRSYADKPLGEYEDVFAEYDDSLAYDVDNPYDGCSDPIRDQPITATISAFESEFSGDEQTTQQNQKTVLEKATKVDNEDVEQQTSLGDVDEDGVEPSSGGLDPRGQPDDRTEQAVYNGLVERCGVEDGEVFMDRHTYPHYIGAVDTATELHEADFAGTVVDPDHEVWQNRPDIADGRVTDESDTQREIEDAFTRLREKGIVAIDRSVGFEGSYEVVVAEVE